MLLVDPPTNLGPTEKAKTQPHYRVTIQKNTKRSSQRFLYFSYIYSLLFQKPLEKLEREKVILYFFFFHLLTNEIID